MTRVGAYLMDIAIQVAIILLTLFLFYLVIIALLIAFGITRSANDWVFEWFADLGGFSIMVLWFSLQWFYSTVFELWWNGQTPGKRMLGLRVLQTDGRPINTHQAMLRNFIRLLDAFPALPLASDSAWLYSVAPVAFSTHLTGFAAAALTKRHQRLGDLACGTMVVSEDRSFVAKVETIDDPQVVKLAEALPASFVPNRSLAKALAHYISRRRYFGPARRQEIASHVGKVLIERLNLPPATDCDLLMCALYMRAFAGDALVEQLSRATSNQMPAAANQPAHATQSTQPTQPSSPYAPQPVAAQPSAGGQAGPAPANPTTVATTEEQKTDWDSIPLG